MNMGNEAIYILKKDAGPGRPFAPDDLALSLREELAPNRRHARELVDSPQKEAHAAVHASRKAVRRTQKAIKRGTFRLYRRMQAELPSVHPPADTNGARDESTATQASDAATNAPAKDTTPKRIPPVVTASKDGRSQWRYLPGWSMDVTLRDGTEATLRPLRADDKTHLREGFERLSATSRYQRFMTTMDSLPESYLRYLTEIDYVDHFAVGAAIEDPARFDVRGLAIARFIALPQTDREAELAITVTDEAQGQGLGMILMQVLLAAAQERGIKALRAEVLPTNAGMQNLAQSVGGERTELHDGMATWRIPVPPQDGPNGKSHRPPHRTN